MNSPEPMAAQWAQVDDMVETLVRQLKLNSMTTSDIAMDMATLDVPNRTRVLAMVAATALQQLASKD